MIVDISKISVKKIRELIVFTAFLVVALWKFNVVLDVLKVCLLYTSDAADDQ